MRSTIKFVLGSDSCEDTLLVCLPKHPKYGTEQKIQAPAGLSAKQCESNDIVESLLEKIYRSQGPQRFGDVQCLS